MNQTVFIGGRLREERARLGLSQPAIGEIGGVTKKTQVLYEAGERNPDSAYLAAIADAGADVLYILTGQRNAVVLSTREQVLLAGYRGAHPSVRAAMETLAGAAPAPAPAPAPMSMNLSHVGDGAVQVGHVGGSVKVGGVKVNKSQNRRRRDVSK